MDQVIPLEFYLCQNYPNPFKESTIIKYCVAYKTRVQITVYNSEGKEIIKLVDEEKNPGTYEVEFSISAIHSSERGNPKEETFSYCLKAGDYKSEKKMILIK